MRKRKKKFWPIGREQQTDQLRLVPGQVEQSGSCPWFVVLPLLGRCTGWLLTPDGATTEQRNDSCPVRFEPEFIEDFTQVFRLSSKLLHLLNRLIDFGVIFSIEVPSSQMTLDKKLTTTKVAHQNYRRLLLKILTTLVA